MVFVALTLTWLLEVTLAVSVLIAKCLMMPQQLSRFWQDDGHVPSLLPVEQWQG